MVWGIALVAAVALGLGYVWRRSSSPRGVGAFRSSPAADAYPAHLMMHDTGDDDRDSDAGADGEAGGNSGADSGADGGGGDGSGGDGGGGGGSE